MRLFLPDGKGIFRLWLKIPGGSKPPPYGAVQSRYVYNANQAKMPLMAKKTSTTIPRMMRYTPKAAKE